ncbi:MAG: efflux RND transporter permease subunit [Gammaproteobacteria bacterium]
MFRFAINNAVIVTVGMLLICLFGILAVFRSPVQMIPDLEVRVVRVSTVWPGATPQDIEKEIIIEQEEYLRNIQGLQRLTSTANTGSARIELEFPFGTNISDVLIEVNNALSQVPGYPENVDEPRIIARSFSDNSFMFYAFRPLEGNPENVDMPMMRDFFEDNIAAMLERVPGVAEVNVSGGVERQVRIYLDPDKLAERGISLIDVRNAVRARNRDVSGGDLDSGKRRYLLRTRGRFESVEELNDMVVARRGGAFIRLRDVGYVDMGGSEIRSYAYLNDQPAVGLSVRRVLGSNVIQVMENVESRVAELNAGILKERGVKLVLTSEDASYVKDAVAVVWKNLLIGAVLAISVLFLFLRSTSATLVGAVGIPICAISAFLGLLLTGRTINVISLAGVAFAIGMTLDNSIVVLENIYRHMAQGKARFQAALDGVREVWTAVLASTLTTVFVFIPIVFIKEEAGQLYSDIAIAVSASILMSMLVAITLIPTACSRFLTPATPGAGGNRLYRAGQSFGTMIMHVVERLMGGIGRRVTLVAFVILIAVGIQYFLTPQAEYLPEGEESKVFTILNAPPGYNINEMHQVYKELNDSLLPYVGEDPEKYDSGELDFPPLLYIRGGATNDRIFMLLHAVKRQHADDVVRLVSKMVSEIPGMNAFASRGSIFVSNWGGTRSINVDISGPELAELFDAGFRAFNRAQEIFDNPRVRLDPSNLTMGQPMLEIRPDWERASELGIDPFDLGYTVWAYTDGAFVDEFFLDDEKIDIYLYSTDAGIEHPGDLEHILLYSETGGMVPLSAVAAVRESVNTETIRRVDGARTLTLSVIPPDDVALETGVEIVERDLIQWMKDSPGVSDRIYMELSGASDLLKATRQALSGNFLVALLTAYLLMVAIFSHWGYPLLIMTTVPIGISGGIIGLWLLNAVGGNLAMFGLYNVQQPFDMITMMGFLVLIGTVVNNPILIVERSIRNLKEHAMSAREAVMESTHARLRPIMMTTITTVFGLSPLVFNAGAGTELYRGLGAIVMFGLLFSSLITLTFMPSLLSLILELRERRLAHNPREAKN